jgi:hypothetical protein
MYTLQSVQVSAPYKAMHEYIRFYKNTLEDGNIKAYIRHCVYEYIFSTVRARRL